jgi:hypothetical protein
MKPLLIAVLIITALLIPSAMAQTVIEVPECKPDLKAIINTLADYDVLHVPVILDSGNGHYWGVTMPAEKTILISTRPSESIRKLTVLHELIHVCYRNIGLDTLTRNVEEELVERQAQEMYTDLFGAK